MSTTAGTAGAEDARLAVLDPILDRQQAHATLATELFEVVDLLGSDSALRRAVTDPGAAEEARRGLVTGLLGGRISAEALAVVQDGVARRWQSAATLLDALERQGIRAALAHAQAEGRLDRVEDELFRFGRTVAGDDTLREGLTDRFRPAETRRTLVDALLADKVAPESLTLARRAVGFREGGFDAAIDLDLELAAAQRLRVLATVRVARPLSADQTERLARVLGAQLGHPVRMLVVVDPQVLGGVRVEVGNEVIDGTVAGRLAEARMLFS